MLAKHLMTRTTRGASVQLSRCLTQIRRYALALLDGDFDYRTDNGKTAKAFRGVLIHHLGGEQRISGRQMILVDQAVRLQLLARIAWMHSHRNGNFKVGGEATGAFDAYLRVTRALREVLAMLGLKRREIAVTLGDILRAEQQEQHHESD
jgi:hypothetical protein